MRFKISSVFLLVLATVVVSQESWESPKTRKKGNFLNIFQNCVVNIRNFDSDGGGGATMWEESSHRYLVYFGSKSPVTVKSIRDEEDMGNNCGNNNVQFQNQSLEAGKCSYYRAAGQVERSGRRVECSAQLYFIERIVGEKGDFLTLHKILEEVVYNNENPHYVIFIRSQGRTEESPEFKRSELGFYSNLFRLSLTSKFLVVDPRQKSVSMVCMHCRGSKESQLVRISTSEVRSLRDLEELWNGIHGNLRGRSVDAIKYGTEEVKSYQAHGCGLHRAGLQTDPNLCAIVALSHSLNMTPFATNYKVYGLVKSGMMSYADYNEQIFSRTSTLKYEWATTAEHFEPFIYITVVDKDALNISALWRTFDPPTWAILVSTFVGMAALFAATISSRFEVMRSRLINLKFTFVLFTAILLEQSQLTIWKVKMRLNAVSNVIIIGWIFTSIVISSLYRGTIYSYLAASLPPPIPATTQSLVESPYFLVTATAYHFQGKPYSTLVSILDEMMIGKPGEDFPAFYHDLKQKLHFIPVTHAEFVKARKYSSPLLALNSHKEMMPNSSPQVKYLQTHPSTKSMFMYKDNMYIFQNLTLPPDLAIIGSEFDIETLQKLMETFVTTFVQKSSTVHTFLNRTPWVIKRNFFLRLFHPALAHLYESGIYSRWRKLGEIGYVANEFNKVDKLLRGQEEHGSEENPLLLSSRPNYLALLLSGLKTGESHTLKPKPLSFEVFDSALAFYILCTSVSISIFAIEWCFFVFSKVVLKVDRNRISSKNL